MFTRSDVTTNNLNQILLDSQKRYGNVMCRILFNVLRTIDPTWKGLLRYPALDESQNHLLVQLRRELDHGDEDSIDSVFLKTCYSLFAHERHQYPVSMNQGKFFSPINLFVVFYSLNENGGFRIASEITTLCASIEYFIRAVMLKKIDVISKEAGISSFEYVIVVLSLSFTDYLISRALKQVKPYLETGHETPMAFVYNVHRVLRSVRSDEVTAALFHFGANGGRELTYHGDCIRLSQIRHMHDQENIRYERAVQELLFFGEDIPSDLFPTLDLESIVDNASNVAVGYSFLDDPRNDFDQFRGAYGAWLLADPDRAERYVYLHAGELVWRPTATLELLKRMEKLRGILAPGVSYSTLLQVRGTEFARALLRNTTGALRNMRFEMHLPTHVALQDKTSHLHLKDRHIPHVITREWAESLIRNLVVFRPFEEVLVGKLLGDDVLHRYRIQMWPGLKSTMTPETFADLCGGMTLRYLGHSFKPLRWRSMMTAFARYLPNSRAFEANQELFVDVAMMHSSSMSNNRYGRHSDQAEQADFRTTIGCIQAGLDFQRHVGIGQARPYSLTLASETVQRPAGASEGMYFVLKWFDIYLQWGVGSSVTSEQLTNSILPTITFSLEETVKETILNSMADVMARLLPKAPRPLDENNLRPVSDVEPHPSRLHSLRRFLKREDANFTCPEQAVLLELMCRGTQSVLGVLGTGKGKTMIIFLYAHLFGSRGITIVILPLSSLVAEFMRRAQELGVSASVWTPSQKHSSDVQLMCVSIEHATFDAFREYVDFFSSLFFT